MFRIFIERPILSSVISIIIVILGIIGLFALPIEQYPDIAPPTVRVSASYTGANAETVLKSVVIPLEEQINGVEDMIYMSSTASNNGFASIDVYSPTSPLGAAVLGKRVGESASYTLANGKVMTVDILAVEPYTT